MVHQPDMPRYDIGVFAFAASAVIEVMAEPLWIFYQIQLNIRLKIYAEGVSLGFSTLLTMTGLYLFPHWGLVVPAIAQVLGKMIYVAIFIMHAKKHIKEKVYTELQALSDVLPSSSRGGASWYKHHPKALADLAVSFFKHGIVKQLLTEGEKYMMTFFDALSFAQQGLYDVVNSLGSLIPRFLFHVC